MSKPMSMQPAKARQNGRGLWLYKWPLRRRISDFSSQAPLHADDGHAECVSCLGKSNADAALSGTDCSHCEYFSLASLRSRIAFFSVSEEKTAGKKQRGRGLERPETSELTFAQCPRASPSPQREDSQGFASSLNLISVPMRLRATWSRSVGVTTAWTAFPWRLRTRKSFRARFLTPPSCRRPPLAAPDPEWTKSSSVSWQRLSVSSGLSGLRLRSRLAAGWTSGFSRGASKPPRQRSSPSFQKSTTSSLNRGAPPTRLAGLAGHPRCVRVDNGYDKTRLFTPIRLKTTALPWCGRHHSAQRGRSSPARRGDASAGKGSHRSVPPAQSESGFYSHYFLIPKKDGGLRPILDLRLLNHTLTKRSFRMITLKQILSQIRPGDWFMSLDLKDAYFHIQVAVTDDSWDSHSRGWHINTRSSRLGCPWLPALLRDVWTRLSPLCDRWEFASLTTLTTGSFWPSQKPF